MESAGVEHTELCGRGFRFNVYSRPSVEGEGTLVCHHGVGSSAMTFARLFEAIGQLNPRLGLLAFDTRHHGLTTSLTPETDEDKSVQIRDLDMDTLVEDFLYVLTGIVPKKEPLMLLGHSMGGTVVSKASNERDRLAVFNLRGLIVVDAVEGYAKQALSSMHSLLSLWPDSFSSIEDAVKWHLGSGHQLRNRASAQLSVPPLLCKDGRTGRFVWKLDLRRTESNWDNWFLGLDDCFVTAPAARLLILAGTGRLDTPLTRAQMQGKFQLMILNEAGHYIQEDYPGRVAQGINEFWNRNGRPLKIVPKFGVIRQD